MWLIVWREHGIFGKPNENGFFGLSTSPEVRQLFKESLKKLALQYSPNLTIIAGTLLTQKPTHSYVLFRNTCYVFHGNEISMHDKMSPFKETKDNHSQLISIFQAGSKKTNNKYLFEVFHPTTKVDACFGIEICFENQFAILKNASTEQPLIHFLLSNTCDLNIHNACGDYLLQLDSDYIPKLLYLGKNNDKHLGMFIIVLYQNNFADPNDHVLQGPFASIYPFEKKVVDVLDDFLEQHAGLEEKSRLILELKNTFINESGQCKEKNSYPILIKLLTEWKDYIVATYFALSAEEKKLYDTLFQLIAHEIKNNTFNKDYLVKAKKEIPSICSGSKTPNPFRHADESPAKKRRF